MFQIGDWVTLKDQDCGVFIIEEVLDRDGHRVKIRSLESDAKLDVDINNLIKINKNDLLKLQEIVKERAAEADDDLSSNPVSEEQWALAQSRFNAFKKFAHGRLKTREEVCAELKIGRSTFYTLLEQFDEELGVESMVVNLKGRKKGSTLLSEEQEDAIIFCYNKYALVGWTLSHLYSKLQPECHKRNI